MQPDGRKYELHAGLVDAQLADADCILLNKVDLVDETPLIT
jgi:G3E family GTPase